jgi:hypothetical protein
MPRRAWNILTGLSGLSALFAIAISLFRHELAAVAPRLLIVRSPLQIQSWRLIWRFL